MSSLGITVHSTLGDLARDCVNSARTCQREMRGVISEGIRVGNTLAKDNARRTAGRHGKLYPRAFTSEMRPGFRGSDFNIYAGEYGPDIALPQGDMEFEWGSRNQDPHLDLNKSADVIGPAMAGETRSRLDRVFW